MSESTSDYASKLGEQLRNVRQQQGLSLQDVENNSEGSLKASVVGAYERGERAVSVTRLRLLADFYKVPITQLLPKGVGAAGSNGPGERRGVRLDLTRLEIMAPFERQILERFLSSIQVRRGDYNGRVLTIRGDDLDTLSAILDVEPETLRERMVAAGGGVDRSRALGGPAIEGRTAPLGTPSPPAPQRTPVRPGTPRSGTSSATYAGQQMARPMRPPTALS